MRGEGSTQAGRVRLWTAWWGPDKGHRPAVPPALTWHRTAQPFPNVASASGAAVGGWSPRRASAGESGRRLCKATSGWAGAFCPSAGQNHSHVLWELLAPAREPRAGPGTPHALRGTSEAKCRAGRPLCVSVPRSASLSHLLDLMWFFFVLPVTYDTLLQSPGNSPR